MKHLATAGLFLIAFAAPRVDAQTNQQTYHNGVGYFFGNPVTPPTDATTITRSFGSATSIGNRAPWTSPFGHPLGVQQDGFVAWSGQANRTPSLLQPVGFSLLELRRGGSFRQASGSTVAVASWSSSLPCSAPWFWLVTFTWGTTFTQTASTAGARQNFAFSLRGEKNQTLANQNYFTGSGSERNLNSGGLSFLEDTSVNLAFQLVGSQEWSHSYFQVDAVSQENRDPSAGTSFSFGFDQALVGTGGTRLRSASSLWNPGAPADALAIRHTALQQLTGISNVFITLLTSPAFGGRLSADATGTIALPGPDPRPSNVVPDTLLSNLGLHVSIFLTTGGRLRGSTGDIGFSGSAQTMPLNLTTVHVPPALQPLRIQHQAIGVQLPGFSEITSASSFLLD